MSNLHKLDEGNPQELRWAAVRCLLLDILSDTPRSAPKLGSRRKILVNMLKQGRGIAYMAAILEMEIGDVTSAVLAIAAAPGAQEKK